MSNIQGPVVHVGADTADVDQAFAKAGEAVEHFGHAMHAMEGALGFEKIKDVFLDVVHASAQAEMSQRKFEAALQSTGQAANPEAFYKMADALQKTTTFQADATIEAGAMFARFQIGQSDIQALMPHLQDLSVSMGTSLPASADAMGRAIRTGGEGLRALGMGFTVAEKQAFQMASQSERVQILMRKMAVFRGAAAAAAKTAAGAEQQYHNATEDLAQAFGKIIDKPVAAFFHAQTAAVSKLTDWFKNLSPEARDAVAAIATSVGVLAAAAAGAAALAGALGMLGGFLPAIAAGFGALGGLFTGVVLPIVGAIAAVLALRAAWDSNLGGMRDTLTTWGNAIAAAFEKVVSYLKTTLPDAIQKASDFAIWAAGKVMRKSDEEIQAIITASHQTAGGIFNPDEAKKAAGAASNAIIKGTKAAGNAMIRAGKELGGDLVAWGTKAGKALASVLQSLGLGGIGSEEHTGKKTKGNSAPDVEATLKDLLAGKALGLTGDFANQGASSMATHFAAKAPAGAKDASGYGLEQASKFMRDTAKATGMTDAAMEQLVNAFVQAGKKGPELVAALTKTQQDAAAQQPALTQAAANITAYWDSAEGQFRKAAASVIGAGQQIGMNLLAAGGAFGQMMGNVMGALDKGDVVGAAVAAVTSFITQSKSFQNVMAQLNSIMSNLAQAFNPLFDALAPIIAAVGTIARAVGGALGGIFKALQPVFATVGVVVKAIASVLGPLISAVLKPFAAVAGILGGVFKALLPIIKTINDVVSAIIQPLIGLMSAMSPLPIILDLLKPVFEALHKGLSYVSKLILNIMIGIGTAYNSLIGFVAGFFDKLASALPDWAGGSAVKDFANSIRGASMDVGSMRKSLQDLNSTTYDTEGQFSALQPPMDGLDQTASDMNAPSGFKATLERFNAALNSSAASAPDPSFTQDSSGHAGAAASSVGQAVAGASGGASAPGGTVVSIASLNVQSASGNAGQSVIGALQQAIRTAQWRLSGSTEGTLPSATPRTAPAGHF